MARIPPGRWRQPAPQRLRPVNPFPKDRHKDRPADRHKDRSRAAHPERHRERCPRVRPARQMAQLRAPLRDGRRARVPKGRLLASRRPGLGLERKAEPAVARRPRATRRKSPSQARCRVVPISANWRRRSKAISPALRPPPRAQAVAERSLATRVRRPLRPEPRRPTAKAVTRAFTFRRAISSWTRERATLRSRSGARRWPARHLR